MNFHISRRAALTLGIFGGTSIGASCGHLPNPPAIVFFAVGIVLVGLATALVGGVR